MDEQVEGTEQSPQTPEGTEAGVSEGPAAQEISQNSRNMAMLCHLLGLLTNFLGPLILWLIKKDEDAFVDEQGKEALNFQIAIMIAGIVAGLSTMICIGVVLVPLVGILDLVFSIMACIAASKGVHYRYPVSIRLVK